MKILSKTDIILALSWLAAFGLSLPLIEPYEFSRLGAYCMIALFAVIGIGRELAGPGLVVSRSPVMAGVLSLWGLALLSLFWTPAPTITLIAFADLTLFVAGFVIFASGRGIFRTMLPMMPTTYLILCGLAVWALLQYFVFHQFLVKGNVYHPFADANAFAALLMLGFFPIFGWVIASVGKKTGIGAAVIAALLLAGIILIGGRGVFLLTLAGIVVTLFLCRGMARRNIGLIAVVLFAGVLAFAAQYLGFQTRPGVLERSALLLQGDDTSVTSRLDLFAATWAIIRDHIWTGTGFGTFFLYYPEYRLVSETGSAGLMAHNDLLQYWAELGVLGAILLLVVFGGAFLRMGKVLCRRGPESGERAICLGLFMGSGLVGLHSLMTFNLYVASVLCLLGPVFGLWLRYSGLALGEVGRKIALPAAWPRMAGYALVALPAILLIFFLQGFLLSHYYVKQAQASVIEGDLTRFSELTARASRVGFGMNGQPFVLAASVPIGIVQHNPDLESAIKAQMAAQAGSYLDKAEAANPRMVAIYYNRGMVARYGLGEEQAARDWFTHALRLNPRHIPSRMVLADMLYQSGEREEAVRVLDAGLDWPYHIHDPEEYYTMAMMIAVDAGDEDVMARAARKLNAWRNLYNREYGKAQKTGPAQVPPAISVDGGAPIR